MKVLLVAPSIGLRTKNSWEDPYRERIFLAPPQGLYQISGHLQRLRHKVEVFDPNLSPEDYPRVLKDTSWDIIGFSPTHVFLEYDLSLIIQAKILSPDSRIILGGMEATFNARRLLNISGADAIVVGEGEYTAAELCGTDDWRNVPGLYLPDNKGLRYTANREPLNKSEFEEMVTGVPIEDIPYTRYWNHISRKYDEPLTGRQRTEIQTVRLYTSNYCPRGCSFCASTRFRNEMAGRKARVVGLEPQKVCLMIERVIKTFPNTRTIFFSDDNFVTWPGRVRAICDEIIEAKRARRLPKELTFIASTTIYQVEFRLLSSMAQAGFRVLDCGIESLSPVVLKEFRRSPDIAKIHRNIKLLIESPIQPYFTLILTSPGTSLKDLIMTLEGALHLVEKGIHLSINNCCWAIRGTKIMKPGTMIRRRKTTIPGTDVTFEKEDILLPSDPRIRSLLDSYYQAHNRIRQQWLTRYTLSHFTSRYNSLAILAAWFEVLGFRGNFGRVLVQLEREVP